MKNLEAREQRKYLLKLFHASKPYQYMFYFALCLQVISVVLTDIISPLVVSKILVDLANEGKVESIGPYRNMIYLLVVLEVLGLSLRRGASFLEERFNAKSQINIVTSIFSKLLEQPASFHQNRFVGTTVNLISKSADCFGRTSGVLLFSLLPLIVIFIGTGLIMIPRVPLYFVALVVLWDSFHCSCR